MRDDGWESPCLQLRFIPHPLPPTKHRPGKLKYKYRNNRTRVLQGL